jgi:hypothetical protein
MMEMAARRMVAKPVLEVEDDDDCDEMDFDQKQSYISQGGSGDEKDHLLKGVLGSTTNGLHFRNCKLTNYSRPSRFKSRKFS